MASESSGILARGMFLPKVGEEMMLIPVFPYRINEEESKRIHHAWELGKLSCTSYPRLEPS
jgi:hypothetical protein